METLIRNLRFGVRMLHKQPTVSANSVLALALGIGLTTTMFSILHAALRDLPFEEPQEIVMVERTAPVLQIEHVRKPLEKNVRKPPSFEKFVDELHDELNEPGKPRRLFR